MQYIVIIIISCHHRSIITQFMELCGCGERYNHRSDKFVAVEPRLTLATLNTASTIVPTILSKVQLIICFDAKEKLYVECCCCCLPVSSMFCRCTRTVVQELDWREKRQVQLDWSGFE